MTLALADQSSLPNLGPTWLWVILAAAALAALAKCIVDQITNAPTQDADVSHLDALDGLSEGQPACHSPGPRGGHYVRAAGAWWVCEACGQTWARGDAPYDQEADGPDLCGLEACDLGGFCQARSGCRYGEEGAL